MCGIAGMMVIEPDRGLGARVGAMTQRLFHRGPDDGGVVAFGPVSGVAAARLGRPEAAVEIPAVPAQAALGARRLAILDLSQRGHQPMASRDRLAWVVHNGEIYNYVELRESLAADGWVFESQSDTEVVLAAWQAWGPGCFRRFDGMWATAIYEPDARRLIVSRDPFGIKPLYCLQTRGVFAFASEIKALLDVPGYVRRVNRARLMDFLCEGWLDHSDETLFEGIRALPGGCRLQVEAGESGALRVASYRDDDLDAIASEGSRPGSSDRAAQHGDAVCRALEDSIRLHLRSDVPVGSCLSGGIDSAAIVSLVCESQRGHASQSWSQHTFTATLPGDPLDESRYAELVGAACPELRAHRVAPSAEGLLADLDRVVWHQEEPFASPSIYMQWVVMQAARQAGITVLLDGQGGDELFCGYSGYFPPLMAQLIRENRFSDAAAIFRSPAARRHFSRSSLGIHAAAHLLPDAARAVARRVIRRWQCDWVGARATARARPAASDDLLDDGTSARMRPFDQYWLDLLRHRSLPALLHFEDRSSMAFSIEARVPFLSRGMFRVAASIPAEDKMRGGWTKAVLRDGLRGRVPDAILNRVDKIGFAAPTLRWMQRPLREWWRDILASASARQRGWIRMSKIDPLVQRLDAGDQGAALALWRMAVAEQWARRLIGS